MRRAFLIALVAAVAALGAVSSSSAAARTYRGGGPGIHVQFRVRGRKIVEATIRATLYCRDGGGRPHRDRVVYFYGYGQAPPATTVTVHSPIPLRHGGHFGDRRRWREEEPGFTEEGLFAGRVGRQAVTGVFLHRFRHTHGHATSCQTGGFQALHGPTARRGVAVVHLRASHRRQSRSG